MSAERSHETVPSPVRSVGCARRPSNRSPPGPAASHSVTGARASVTAGIPRFAVPPVPCRGAPSCADSMSSASSIGIGRSLNRLPSSASRPGESDRAVVTAALRVPASRSSSASSKYQRLRVSGRSSTTNWTCWPCAEVDTTARPSERSRRNASAAELADAPAVCAHSVATRCGPSSRVGIIHTRRPRRLTLGTPSTAATPYEPGTSGCSSSVTDQLPADGAGRSSKPGP